MPNLIGSTLANACEALIAAGLYTAPEIVQAKSVPGSQPGTVLSQVPASGASVSELQASTVTVVRGTFPAIRTGGVIPYTVFNP